MIEAYFTLKTIKRGRGVKKGILEVKSVQIYPSVATLVLMESVGQGALFVRL